MAGASIFTAILGFAFVIFIHELGHFLFAKWAGVKVERFSIGMGPIIWSRTIGETEYALSILPVGGYVKMLGQSDVPGEHVESADERSYSNKHPAWKAAILFAGVLFNIVSSYIILLILAWYGMPTVSPQVGMISQYVENDKGERLETPAWKHDLRVGDQILELNGQKIRSFTDLMMYSIGEGKEPINLKIRRQDGNEFNVDMHAVYDKSRGTHTLGIDPPGGLRVSAIISSHNTEHSLQIDDRIVGIVGEAEDYDALNLVAHQAYNRLSARIGEEISLQVDRNGERLELPFTYAGRGQNDIIRPSLGTMIMVEEVVEDSPAANSGVLTGDLLASINDTPIKSSSHMIGMVRKAALNNQSIKLDVYRLDDKQELVLKSLNMSTTIDPHTGSSIIGIRMNGNYSGRIHRALNDEQLAHLQQHNIDINHVIIDAKAGKLVESVLSETDILYAKQGRIHMLPFISEDSQAFNKKMHHVKPIGFWGRLFRISPKKSIWQRLGNARITQTADKDKPTLQVEKLDLKDSEKNEVFEIDLLAFEPNERESFYALEKGDIVLPRSAATKDGPAFMVLRGAANEDIARQSLPLLNSGSIIGLMVEERPYQLSSWTEGFSVANDMCKQMIVTTIRIIPRFFKSPEAGGIEASKSLSGPIGIFTGMKQKTEYFGFASFLKLLAFIGINLFLVNLLPIPIVDGGQLVFLGIEVIIRRPVPTAVIEISSYIGLLLIVSLMIYVIGIDIDRHFLQ